MPFRKKCASGIATREEIAAIDRKVKAEIDEAVKVAVSSPYPKPEEAAKDYFA